MEAVTRMMTAGSRVMTPLVTSLVPLVPLVMLVLLVNCPSASGKLRGVSLRQGALNLPPLDPALIRGILPPEEISAFSRQTVLSRRHMIRQIARQGLPQFGVGPLDPLAVDDMPLNFTMDVVELEGNITNGKVRGLENLQLLDIDIHVPGLSIAADLRLPLVTLDANYSLDGSFSGLFPLTGKGPLTLKLIDVDVKVIMQARLYYDRLHITRVDFTLAIANTTINLEGFLEDSGFGEIAQQFLDGMSGDFLRNFIKTFREERLPMMVMRGNKFLKDFQWRSFLPTFVALYLGFDDDSGSPYYKDYIPTITNNHLVDRVLHRLSHFLYGQRIGLPAQDIMATKKILFTWWVRTGIQLFKGHLFGAHNLRRASDALISRHKEYFTFTIEVVVFNLKAAYKAQLIVLNRPVKFTLWAFISHIKMRVQVQLDAEYMDLYLTGLDVLHIGKIDVKLAGLGPLELVANNVAEKQINSDTTKRLLARVVARDARDAIAKQIRGVDINSILAETINGDVYARDPGIVFPDPEPEGNGTDFNSLLDSVLGASGDGEGGGLGNLINLLFDDDDSSSGGGFNNTDDIDPETLAAFGLDGVPGNSSGATDNPLAGIDADTLAAFGLSMDMFDAGGAGGDSDAAAPAGGQKADTDNPLAGIDADTLAAFGLSESAEEKPANSGTGRAAGTTAKTPSASGAANPLAGIDADTLAAFGLSESAADSAPKAASAANAPKKPSAAGGANPLAGVDADTLAAFGLSESAADSAPKAASAASAPKKPSTSGAANPLAGIDADTLAAFGLSDSGPKPSASAANARRKPSTSGSASIPKTSSGLGSASPLSGVDADTLAAFGLSESAGGDAESPSAPTAAAVELQQILGKDKDGLKLEMEEGANDDVTSLFGDDDNNSFFDSDVTGAPKATTEKAKANSNSDASFDSDDNNSFFSLRRRRG